MEMFSFTHSINLFHFILYFIVFILPNINGQPSCSTRLKILQGGGVDFTTDCSNRGLLAVPYKLQPLTHKLLLNGNRLKDIRKDSFNQLSSLKSIDLSGNDITHLPEGLFEGNGILQSLDLSRNTLHCDWQIWWLVKYSWNLADFRGYCFSPASLQGRGISSLTEDDLIVDCASAKKLKKNAIDGEYRFRIAAGTNAPLHVPVYCHGMDTPEPREYLTLLAGQSKNYVAVSNDEKSCPSISGFSPPLVVQFSRIRIVLWNMTIDGTDDTFTNVVIGSGKVTYGSAGLCSEDYLNCAGGVAHIDLRGTPFQIQDPKWSMTGSGSVTQTVGNSVVLVNCTGTCQSCQPIEPFKVSMIDSSVDPFSACTKSFGLIDGTVTDDQISASSFLDDDNQPSSGRLLSTKYGGWCAANTKDEQYISIDLKSVMTVSGIATQGHRIKFDWVTSYKVFTSDDGANWNAYKGLSNATQIFQGNFDQDTVVTHWFKPRFRTRYVRIYPMSWYQGDLLKHHICMRFELFGCRSDAVSYVIHTDQNQGCLIPTKTPQPHASSNLIELSDKCDQPSAMFAFHHLGMMVHSATGQCLTINANSEMIVNSNCSTLILNFQLIPKQSSSDSSLIIKSLVNGMCANLEQIKSSGRVMLTWKDCAVGGFTIFTASRSGIMPFKPSFVGRNEIIKTKLNQSVVLNCKPNGDPLPQTAWTRDNAMVMGAVQAIQNSSSFVLTNHNALILPKVQWEERGSYFCNVWNSAGNTYKEIVLEVEAFQQFVSEPKDLEILTGETAMFTCLSTGTPPPKVSWFARFGQNASPISVDLLDGVSVLSNGTLVIKLVLPSYSGDFMCISESPGFTRNRSAALYVLVPPKVYLTHKQKSVYVGDSVDIGCIATGDPFPNVTWFKVGNSTEWNPLSTVNGRLSIKSASKQDAGIYVCEASSRIGVVNVTFNLNVTATCPFSLMPFGIALPFQSLYIEEDEILVKCSTGFDLVGQSRLQCLETGAWNFILPTCHDIDECVVGILLPKNSTLETSDGSGSPADAMATPTIIIDDTDSDPCDVNAECSNSPGSFQCVCDDGYVGDGFTCRWNPTTKPKPTTFPQTHPAGITITTVVPTVSLQTLDNMIMGYTMNQVQETDLLNALHAYAKSLHRIDSTSSKSFILRKIMFALWTIVYGSPVENWKMRSNENLKICSEVVSLATAASNTDAWSSMQKNSNGSVELIQAFEGYTMQYTHQLKESETANKQIIAEVSTSNLDVRVTNVASLPMKDVSINLISGKNFAVRIDLPRALAYKGFGRVRYLNSIVYSSLKNILPNEIAVDVNRSAIISPVLSLVVSPSQTETTFSTSFNITFSSSNVVTSIPLCVYWSFNSSIGYGWSDHGCRTIQSDDLLSVTCECNHMTHFAVMETGIVTLPLKSDYLGIKFGITSMIGCFIFVILGIVTCLSHVCCSPYGRSDRRVILVNLCLALVLGMILISGGLTLVSFHLIRMSVAKIFCMLLTGALQFFVVGFFSWTLVEAIHIFLLTRTVLAKGFIRLLWFYIVGWGIPLATITVSYILISNNVIKFESWCWLSRSLVPLLLVIGCPAVFLLLVTLVLYVWVLISLRSTGQLLTAYAQIQASRIVWCSFILQILHILTTISFALFLKFNNTAMFHHILGVVVTIEAIYMLIYHCFLDKVITGGATEAEIKARNRCSYSTKETITYTAPEQEEPNGNKYKITRPTKRDSVDGKSLLVTNGNKPAKKVDLDWDNHYPDMYGSYQHLPSSPETPLAKTTPQPTPLPKTPTKGKESHSSSFASDLDGRKSCGETTSPCRTQTQMSNLSDDYRPRPGCRSNSIVSVETKASGSTAQGIPVYWPSAPPQHQMSLKRSTDKLESIDDNYTETSFNPPVATKRDPPVAKPRPPPLQLLENESPSNRHRSYVETDRVSDISNELTGILQELEVLNSDIDRSPLRSHSNTISGHGIRPAPPKYGGSGTRTLESKRLLDKNNDGQPHMHINMYGNF